MKEQQQKALLTKTELRDRGWTEAAIKLFAGTPDQLKRNPIYPSRAPMSLYELQRIEGIEQSPEFITWRAASEQRRLAAQRAVETKRLRLAEVVKAIQVALTPMPLEQLIRRACDHYNDHHVDEASPSSDPAFLERIQVNYLRHAVTKYDHELEIVKGKVGVHDAYIEISQKVFEAISEAYPHLRTECQRLMELRLRGLSI